MDVTTVNNRKENRWKRIFLLSKMSHVRSFSKVPLYKDLTDVKHIGLKIRCRIPNVCTDQLHSLESKK